MIGFLNNLFDDDEEKKRKAMEGQLPAPVETIQPTQMRPEEPTPSLAELKAGAPVVEEKTSVWDTISDMGDKVVDAGKGAMDYFMDDEATFKKKWLDENLGNQIMADRDPVKLAEHQKKMEEEANSAWNRRQLNRKLAGGALGGLVGAAMPVGGSSVKTARAPGPTGGGKLGSGYTGRRGRK